MIIDHENLSDSLNDSLELDAQIKLSNQNPKLDPKSPKSNTQNKYSLSLPKSSCHKRFLTQQDDQNLSQDDEELEDYLDSCRKIQSPSKKSPAKQNSKKYTYVNTSNKKKYVSIQEYLIPKSTQSQFSEKLTFSSHHKSDENKKFYSRFITFQPDHISQHDQYRIALNQIRTENYQQALQTLDKINSSQPYKDYLYTSTYYHLRDCERFIIHANRFILNEQSQNIQHKIHTYQMMATIQPDKAIESIQKAIEIASKFNSSIDEDQIKKLKFQLAKVLQEQGQIFEASLIYQEDGSIDALHQLCQISFKMRDLEKCIDYSYQLFQQEMDQNKLENVYENLGQLYGEKDQKKEAIDCLEIALKIKLDKYGWKNDRSCFCAMTLGKMYSEMKLFRQANEKFRLANQIISQVRGIHNQLYGKCLIWMGENYFKMRNYKTCLKTYQEALEVYRKVLGLNHEFSLRVQLNIVHVNLKLNQSVKETIQSMIVSCQEENDNLGGIIMNELGNILVKQKRIEDAIKIYEISLQEVLLIIVLGTFLMNDSSEYEYGMVLQSYWRLSKQYKNIEIIKQLEYRRNSGQLSIDVGEIERKMGEIFLKANQIQECIFHYQNAIVRQLSKLFGQKIFRQFKNKEILETTIEEYNQIIRN